MSFWFHRCPQKATAKQSFCLKLDISNAEAIKVLSELKLGREKLMDLLPDPRHDVPKVKAVFENYLALLRGLLEVENSEGVIGVSKLRTGFLIFRWSQSMIPFEHGKNVMASDDALFEYANMMISVAFWFMKHASMRSTESKQLTDEVAKDVHSALKEAASIFQHVNDQILPFITTRLENGSDLDIRIVVAYLNQCCAEAQEITISRAISLQHNVGLISALAYATAKLFTTAADSLQSINATSAVRDNFQRWISYLKCKVHFYEAYAYAYMAEKLINDEKCGEAVRSAKEAMTSHDKMAQAAKEYCKAKSVGPTAKARPEQFAFFHKLHPFVERTLQKTERENSMIFHQRVSLDAPMLVASEKTFGLAAPKTFTMPPLAKSWTPVAYASINVMATLPGQPTVDKSESTVKRLNEYDPKPVQ